MARGAVEGKGELLNNLPGRGPVWHVAKHVGWQLYRAETYVNWCGHGQEDISVPMADGRVTFVLVLGEAR